MIFKDTVNQRGIKFVTNDRIHQNENLHSRIQVFANSLWIYFVLFTFWRCFHSVCGLRRWARMRKKVNSWNYRDRFCLTRFVKLYTGKKIRYGLCYIRLWFLLVIVKCLHWDKHWTLLTLSSLSGACLTWSHMRFVSSVEGLLLFKFIEI